MKLPWCVYIMCMNVECKTWMQGWGISKICLNLKILSKTKFLHTFGVYKFGAWWVSSNGVTVFNKPLLQSNSKKNWKATAQMRPQLCKLSTATAEVHYFALYAAAAYRLIKAGFGRQWNLRCQNKSKQIYNMKLLSSLFFYNPFHNLPKMPYVLNIYSLTGITNSRILISTPGTPQGMHNTTW